MASVRRQPKAVFMAFGTKGDVYPIAAIATAFACDQLQYQVVFITHSAHEDIREHLSRNKVSCFSVSSPPALSPSEYNNNSGCVQFSFHQEKRKYTREHRQECVALFENIFGDVPSMEGDLVIINFFALEGWSLAELFNVRCVVAAPYVVPYSAPSSFERKFSEELPLLYNYLQAASSDKISWKDVIHWMWPLFTDDWGTWRATELKLSPLPFTDPVTSDPVWHSRPSSPLLLYGFSKEIVECPGYWPSNVHVCGFWSLPMEWQFSCKKCAEITVLTSSQKLNMKAEMCSAHTELQHFLYAPESLPPVFIGLSSIGSMGFMRKPQLLLHVLQSVLKTTNYRFILFSSGYGPLDDATRLLAAETSPHSEKSELVKDGVSLFSGRLFCFSGSVPYKWLFPKCAAAIHHGGSGSTAAALHAGIPQVLCPFMLDQFYWAERMFWLGVSPEPLKRHQLLPDEDDEITIKEAAGALTTAISYALSSQVKSNALQISRRLASEDGVQEAVRMLKASIASQLSKEG
ncbi:putative sterol 3-beta-glucosyltransferase [Helianthus annuus]|nr:sterol 3-beta-glucosyltransferase UGT80B1 isoform X2 [Helianthus annuus]XP_035835171.1 sterol 3-beta-glucosyltransferase UGT80B1 isoform X2 [Helianthus annuus]XP_035835172.1 sterol 3-beta-glucosyltransferase UGT80B1 isoform X2 [Helianthus annuus]KAJ0501256.1 putative sterol 3-beta-glucosyltransferase [Helianthus annuus]KAJ0509004.1 putative sterol 3-beta-glucosyltransferase [Helianthus annuus]KAJ0517154.1 putative sterol 3-beta-glucosyltransferase [Helianthus annuus]KAJ0685162.1 putative s